MRGIGTNGVAERDDRSDSVALLALGDDQKESNTRAAIDRVAVRPLDHSVDFVHPLIGVVLDDDSVHLLGPPSLRIARVHYLLDRFRIVEL